MELFKDKKGIILGIANNRSIATAVAQQLSRSGAIIGYSYLPDNTGKMKSRVNNVIDPLEPAFLEPCDVTDDQSIDAFFNKAKYGNIF